MQNSIPKIYFGNRKEWREWLLKNHSDVKGIWLVHDKVSHGGNLTYNDIVEEALCFGWIDGTLRRIDEKQAMIYLTPRRPRSIWAQSNKDRVKKLIKSKLMTQTGLEIIYQAKKDGSWSAFDVVEDLIIPTELEKAFVKNKSALVNFEKLSLSLRKQILYYIYSAKQTETRNNRVKKLLPSLKVGKNPFF